jgi:hypothetical protein
MLRTFLGLTCLIVPAAGARSADTLTTYDDTTIKGRVLRLAEGYLEVMPEREDQVQKVPLGNLTSVKLVPPVADAKDGGALLLVDNDGFHGPTEKSGKVKLRKGLHGFTLLYFQGTQGATLGVAWDGPGIQKQKLPRNRLSKWTTSSGQVEYAAGFDEEGFRLPDRIEETIPQVGYKLYEWSEQGLVSEVADLRTLVIKKYGTMPEVGIDFPHQPSNFGAVIYWLLDVPQDGEYTFYVNSDDGTQLYVGRIPTVAQPSLREPAAEEWLVRLRDQARVSMLLGGWDEQGLHGTSKIANHELKLVIPPTELQELWSREFADKADAVDRSGEQVDIDTVYAKNSEGQVQQVTGSVLGISDGSLRFDYQGTSRTIPLERIAGVVMRQPSSEAPPQNRRVRLRFDLCGSDELVGYLKELTPGRATIELPWGSELSLSRNIIYRMSVLNGRVQLLQDLPPAQVVETPFLDRILHWQAGRSLTGGGLRIGQTSYPTGLCLHSRTKLTWELNGEYERFQCDLGLQHPEGAEGNAAVRITADEAELFHADEVTAAEEPRPLDLDLTGRERLTLEVDFGRNMHLGDHVLFGNARILRPEVTP